MSNDPELMELSHRTRKSIPGALVELLIHEALPVRTERQQHGRVNAKRYVAGPQVCCCSVETDGRSSMGRDFHESDLSKQESKPHVNAPNCLTPID